MAFNRWNKLSIRFNKWGIIITRKKGKEHEEDAILQWMKVIIKMISIQRIIVSMPNCIIHQLMIWRSSEGILAWWIIDMDNLFWRI